MITLESILLRMQQLIKDVDPTLRNIPIGISISASGEYFIVKYSLTQSCRSYSDLNLLITDMDDALTTIVRDEETRQFKPTQPIVVCDYTGENPWPWGI